MRSCRGVFMIVPMHDDITQIAPWERSSAWGRTFASIYDPFLWVGERAGLRAHRHELLGRARGFTVDIGSGTGLNLPHYPDHLDNLVLAEPDPAMRARLERRLRALSTPGAHHRRPSGAAALRRPIGRHRRLNLRAVHGQRPRSRSQGDRPCAAP